MFKYLIPITLLCLAFVSQGHATERTTACQANNNPITYDVTDYGAVPNDDNDDQSGINKAVQKAHSVAKTISGNCNVQVSIPAGYYFTTQSILVPSRVALIGDHFRTTKIHYTGKYHAIQFRTTGSDAPVEFAKVQHLEVTMNNTTPTGINPNIGGGHCISSIRGMHDSEMRNLKLIGCDFYGIGLQTNASSNDSGYERITIQRVLIMITGSDGIDMKSTRNANNDIEFLDMCIQHISFQDDGAWASALDLAGNDIRVDNFTFINSAPIINGAAVNGIATNGGNRSVGDSHFSDFHIQGAAQGVIIDPRSNGTNIHFSGGGVVKDSLSGIILNGSGHTSSAQLFVSGSRKPFQNGGNDIQLSSSAPTTGFFAQTNPVCNY